MKDKKVKNKLRLAIRMKGNNLVTNIFPIVKRHHNGVYLVLQDGLEASLINDNEIMINGARIEVRYDTSDGPVDQMKFVPATLEGIKSTEAELQHLAYEHGLSSDDMITGIRHHFAHTKSQTNEK